MLNVKCGKFIDIPKTVLKENYLSKAKDIISQFKSKKATQTKLNRIKYSKAIFPFTRK